MRKVEERIRHYVGSAHLLPAILWEIENVPNELMNLAKEVSRVNADSAKCTDSKDLGQVPSPALPGFLTHKIQPKWSGCSKLLNVRASTRAAVIIEQPDKRTCAQ